jgi:hypothetical protein
MQNRHSSLNRTCSSSIFSFSKLFYSKVHHHVLQMSLGTLKRVYSFSQVRLHVVKHDLAWDILFCRLYTHQVITAPIAAPTTMTKYVLEEFVISTLVLWRMKTRYYNKLELYLSSGNSSQFFQEQTTIYNVLFFHYRDLFPGVCRKFSQIHIFLFLKSH